MTAWRPHARRHHANNSLNRLHQLLPSTQQYAHHIMCSQEVCLAMPPTERSFPDTSPPVTKAGTTGLHFFATTWGRRAVGRLVPTHPGPVVCVVHSAPPPTQVRYCDRVARSNCRVPIDTAISLLEREIGSAVETRGHLATSYGTANRQPSRQSNPAHLCAALAVIRHIRTNVMVLNTSAIEKYEAAFAQYMEDATDPAHELTEVLAHCPRTCNGGNPIRDFVLIQFPLAVVPVCIRAERFRQSWRLLSGRARFSFSFFLPFTPARPPPTQAPLFCAVRSAPPPTQVTFFCAPTGF
jgi:hypothetical protein